MTMVTLSDVTKIVTKGTTPTTLGMAFQENGIPFIRVNNIHDKLLNFKDNILYIDEQTHEKLSRSVIKPKDVLISIAGSIGRSCVVPDDAPDLNCNQAVCIIRCDFEKILPEYLSYWLGGEIARSQITNSKVTGVIQNLSLTQVKALKIDLPPLTEQRRIASILDKADELRQKRQQAIEKLDQFLQATFIDMFGDPVKNTKNWPLDKNLGDIANIVSGITKGRKITGKTLKETPYLAVLNVQDKYLNLSTIKTIEASNEEIERYKLQLGDLLLTEGGDPDKLGRGTLWNNEIDECIHQNHVFRVRLLSREFTPNYLNWIIGSEYGKRYFLKSAKQTTGIATINMGQLKKLPLFVPPLELQIQFDERCKAIQQIKKQLIDSYEKTNNLFKSLQHRAFNGTL